MLDAAQRVKVRSFMVFSASFSAISTSERAVVALFISSIDQHSRKAGEEAARIALGILNLKVPPKPQTLVLQPELVVHESTQRRMSKNISKKARTGVKRNQSR